MQGLQSVGLPVGHGGCYFERICVAGSTNPPRRSRRVFWQYIRCGSADRAKFERVEFAFRRFSALIIAQQHRSIASGIRSNGAQATPSRCSRHVA